VVKVADGNNEVSQVENGQTENPSGSVTATDPRRPIGDLD